VAVADPVTASASNNVVWLRPARWWRRQAPATTADWGAELAVARHLAASGAPVVAPASQVPRG